VVVVVVAEYLVVEAFESGKVWVAVVFLHINGQGVEE
jgi:hypothetical protein